MIKSSQHKRMQTEIPTDVQNQDVREFRVEDEE